MQPTYKLILLGAFGCVLTAIAAIGYWHVPVFVIFNLILIAFVIIDYMKSPVMFEIERDEEHKLSLYAEETMGWTIYNKSDRPLTIRIKDTIPDFHFEAIEEEADGKIMPHERKHLTYKILPKKRGIYNLSDVHIAYLSRYGLIYKHKVVQSKAAIRVYPNLTDLKKYRLMVYKGFLMRGGKKVHNQRGEGMEFESLREYISGDEYNKINWKATASMNKPIVNQFEVEKNQDVISIIDSGKAMSYEVRGYKKLDLAINTALILSDVANMSGDKSGLMVFNREVQQYVKPSSGGLHRNKLLEALFSIDYNRELSNFEEAFNYLNHHQKKRSIIFLFTEFETMDEASDYMKVLPSVARKHLVILFMMTKEKVVDLAKTTVKKDHELFLKGAALEILEERKKIISTLKRSGIMCIECTPDTLTTEAINQYIQLKKKRF